jgi:hypothetical protein
MGYDAVGVNHLAQNREEWVDFCIDGKNFHVLVKRVENTLTR